MANGDGDGDEDEDGDDDEDGDEDGNGGVGDGGDDGDGDGDDGGDDGDGDGDHGRYGDGNEEIPVQSAERKNRSILLRYLSRHPVVSGTSIYTLSSRWNVLDMEHDGWGR